MQILDLRLLKTATNGEQCVVEGSVTALRRTSDGVTARLSTGYAVSLSVDEVDDFTSALIGPADRMTTTKGEPDPCPLTRSSQRSSIPQPATIR